MLKIIRQQIFVEMTIFSLCPTLGVSLCFTTDPEQFMLSSVLQDPLNSDICSELLVWLYLPLDYNQKGQIH